MSSDHEKQWLAAMRAASRPPVAPLESEGLVDDLESFEPRTIVSPSEPSVQLSTLSSDEETNPMSEETTDTQYEREVAWGCLTPQNPVRKFLFWFIRWRPFTWFIVLAIVVNTAMLGTFDPLDPDAPTNRMLNGSELVFLAIFALEAILKLIAMGAFRHPGAYFRDGWNWLDFLIVIISILAVLPDLGSNLSGIRSLRTLRALRLLRFIEDLNLQITTLFKAGPYLVNALVLLFIFYLMFAIVGLQVFSGRLRQHCVDDITGAFNVEQCCSLAGGGQGFQW
jgi:hypothetical protein